MRVVMLAVLALLVAGCSDPVEQSRDDSRATPVAPVEVESGIHEGQVTALQPEVVLELPVEKEGHGRLAVALVLNTNLPATSLAFEVSGPGGRTSGGDTQPFLYVFPGIAPVVSFSLPPAGDWTATVRLDSGALADYELHWCADSVSMLGPQDNRACQQDYGA
jgi:hypothetical protein